jgi:DNA-binding response OmpR family regulator
MNEHRILIVEDEEDIASLLKLNLESEGYKAIHVGNGDKAIQILKEQKFHAPRNRWSYRHREH